ncbi:NAD(P)/FAD-dependent oxidoreductase [Desulfosporosinus sp.]|uniref:NAD(P)/FAD-dependent oxidoreductase n=1 Tax=Desulfosporosinus sp. TaxID=157907 RepID=UPI0025C2E65A|nr:NAD(P)/FAD-dependent oxidoreductase [Desulfosporosinus sp.]MBC2726066.1 NAD(P)/FAD-dependent oxidoreductase [Desulfosporosinus sp.]
MVDVVIIGCGIVGASVAYELSKYRLTTVVLERENDIATGTTKANSAIIHAGYDPKPGTLMAKLNVEGAQLAQELCIKLHIPYERIGSLVLAFSRGELISLEKLYEQGVQNGVPDIRLLDEGELHSIEPYVSKDAVGALYAPTAAIVNPWEYAIALAETAVNNGVELYLNSCVTAIEKKLDNYLIKTTSGEYEAKFIINAAGVYADLIHNLIGQPAFKTIPNRGQYYLLDKAEGTRVSHIIFQCPTAEGKGVLISPTVHGNLIVGPNSESIVESEDVSVTNEGLSFIAEMALKSVPSIGLNESIRNFAGIRAIADVEDFIIGESATAKNFVNLAGIKSPGLSAAPAIAKMAVAILSDLGLELIGEPSFIGTRKKTRFKELSFEEKNELIKKNPAYGHIVCRCETITEGEILDALNSPIPATTIDGVKRRCNAGMGRCQGGFCTPKVLDIIRRELNILPEDILQDKQGTYILSGESKGGGTARV